MKGAGSTAGKGDSDGQLSLCSQTVTNDYAGLAISYSDEDVYLILTDDKITSQYINDKVSSLDAKSWIAPDLKANLHVYNPEIDIEDRKKYFDMMIAAYLLNPLIGEYPYDGVAKDYLGLMVPSQKEILGKKTLSEALTDELDKAMKVLCYEVYIAWKSMPVLSGELKTRGMLSLYREIEMPVAFVLYDMEKEGIAIDRDALKKYGEDLSVSIAELEKRIYEAAGEEFNINSPKQLGVILFEKLQMPNSKKTKTGYSTSAEVLEKLAVDYPIVSDILEYRQLTTI